jgi:hypothetical protein
MSRPLSLDIERVGEVSAASGGAVRRDLNQEASVAEASRRVAPIETDNQPTIRDGKGLMWARKRLGWSMLEMAENLRMEGPPDKLKGRIHEMEIGTRNVSGPITVAVEAFLWGFRPADRED